MTEKLTPERTVRLLRAKAGELEEYVKGNIGNSDAVVDVTPATVYLAADIALIATLLADHLEFHTTLVHQRRPQKAIDDANVRDMHDTAWTADFDGIEPGPV